jgi:hypothetical protein
VKLWLCARGAPPFQLTPGKDVTIGRGQDCDLSLYSSMLSREHACVRWEGGVPVLFDLESLNGTFIGPDRIRRRRLVEGDVIRLGDLQVLFCSGEEPPPPPAEGGPPLPLPDPTEEPELSSETRPFSRTEVMHQKVFDYDELGWLQARAEPARAHLLDRTFPGDLPRWVAADPQRARLLWSLLEWGVLAPDATVPSLRGLEPGQLARLLKPTKRGEKLLGRLGGQRTAWNEMASLRYQLRQGPIYASLRLVARAYRPGSGLADLSVATLRYELENIYAADLAPDLLERELRRLLVLGALAPGPGVGEAAWFPADWSDGSVVVSPRGRNVLEGFRLEDE